ncbi:MULTISPECIES: hypothetical protein [Streptomyces]|uniref:Secreted protein n=1 Tax=Streptomyces osmaniensis TaxID=593134 RepID=A0ABP6WU29_9ACTN|nr:hypothetical protein [Streptomyces sp. KS_5]QWA21614.1 hypothetical protein KJK32_10630 [Streptomyces sp. JCM17656]SED72470.1 hypothetical protein SAMN05428938_5761 [Streptomyces sp. KS_5]
MRLSRRLASTTVAVALVLPVSCAAIAHARVHSAEAGAGTEPAEPFGAACRISVTGSRVTAFCHNPYPETDSVSLHVECARWWDLDSDGSPVAAEPAQTVRMTARCWKEIDSAWVSHRREG